jgi:hypothetical protein
VGQFLNPRNLISSTKIDETITIKLKPKLFLILVVITLDQAWPSYFLSTFCIYDEEGLLGENIDISNSMSLLNVMGEKETF